MVIMAATAVETEISLPAALSLTSRTPQLEGASRGGLTAAPVLDLMERLRRARESAAIEAEDVLAQAEEAGGFDPIG